MALINGISYIKLYENKTCTREFKKDILGNYILTVGIVSSNNYNPHNIVVWCKNVGSHKAYNVKCSVLSSNLPNVSVSGINDITILSEEVKKCTVEFPITRGISENYTVSLKLEYDSI